MLLSKYRDFVVGGHSGELKTYLRLAKVWYWAGMKQDVAEYVQRCVVCLQQKVSQQLPAGLLQPLRIPTKVWDEISINFEEGLLMSKGVYSIFVVVDRLSKYEHFIGLQHPFDAFTVAEVFIQEIVCLHEFQ